MSNVDERRDHSDHSMESGHSEEVKQEEKAVTPTTDVLIVKNTENGVKIAELEEESEKEVDESDTNSEGSDLGTPTTSVTANGTSFTASIDHASVGASATDPSSITNESITGMKSTGNQTEKMSRKVLPDGSVEVKKTYIQMKEKNGKKYQVKTTTTKVEKRKHGKTGRESAAVEPITVFTAESFLKSVSHPRNGGNVSFTDPWTNIRVMLPRPETPKPRRA